MVKALLVGMAALAAYCPFYLFPGLLFGKGGIGAGLEQLKRCFPIAALLCFLVGNAGGEGEKPDREERPWKHLSKIGFKTAAGIYVAFCGC